MEKESAVDLIERAATWIGRNVHVRSTGRLLTRL